MGNICFTRNTEKVTGKPVKSLSLSPGRPCTIVHSVWSWWSFIHVSASWIQERLSPLPPREQHLLVFVGLGFGFFFPFLPVKGKSFVFHNMDVKKPPGHHIPRKTVTLEHAKHACPSEDFHSPGFPRPLPAAAQRPKPLPRGCGHFPARPAAHPAGGTALPTPKFSHPREPAGQKHPRQATNRGPSPGGSSPGTSPGVSPLPRAAQSEGLREELPAAGPGPAATKSRGPKPGRKKSFARPPPRPREGAQAAAPRRARRPLGHRIPVLHPYDSRRGIPGAAPLQPPAPHAAVLGRFTPGTAPLTPH